MTVEHYETLLAPVYDWMLGGWEAATQRHRDLFAELDLTPVAAGALAIDVGAGTGHQSIPLAERGYRVEAVEPSPAMRARLRDHIGTLPIVFRDEPLSADPSAEPELICCMGDTLAHFASLDDVAELATTAGRVLQPGGTLVVSYRDSTSLPSGDDRFIAVRSDHERILTCLLEEAEADRIRVSDILHTRSDEGFDLQVSSYCKLRLRPATVDECIEQGGLEITGRRRTGTFVTTVATRP